MDRYKLAVVIPCWNCSKEIGPMLDGIIDQTFGDWRVYCVDDLSTDNTFQVLQQYARKDKRIVAVQRPREPKGAQTCRNYGFELAEGAEYVIWFDSDERVRFMDSHPELDFGVFKAKSFFKNIYETEGCELFGYEYKGTEDLRRFLRRTLPFVGWTNIYRWDSLNRANLSWDENIMSLQDSDINIQSILKGLRYQYVEEGLIDYFYRVNKSSVSKKNFTEAHKKSHIYFLNKLHSSLNEEQKKKYRLELDDYLFFFFDQFYYDDQFMGMLYQQEWMKGRKWMKARMDYDRSHQQRSTFLLFPIIRNYKRVSLYNRRYAAYNWQQLLIETGKIIEISKEHETSSETIDLAVGGAVE